MIVKPPRECKRDSACKIGKNNLKFFLALKVNIDLQNMRIKRNLVRFDQKLLPASLIMHVSISELHAQWH